MIRLTLSTVIATLPYRVTWKGEGAMAPTTSSGLAYIACAILVATYAWVQHADVQPVVYASNALLEELHRLCGKRAGRARAAFVRAET